MTTTVRPQDVSEEHQSPVHQESLVYPNIRYRSDFEERWNFATHALGVVLAVAANWFLLVAVSGHRWFVQLTVAFYGVNMIALYAASTLSHYHHRSPWRGFFRRLDQSLIFLFIISGFTPYFAVYVTEVWAWIGIAGLWCCAVTGFVSKLFFGHRVEGIATWTYLALAWGPIVGMPFAESLPLSASLFIVAGGAAYMIGIVFLLLDRRHWCCHSIWHLLVITGTAIHYFGVHYSLLH